MSSTKIFDLGLLNLMSSKIVGWLVGARDGKILGFKKKSGIKEKIPEKIRKWWILNFCQRADALKSIKQKIMKKITSTMSLRLTAPPPTGARAAPRWGRSGSRWRCSPAPPCRRSCTSYSNYVHAQSKTSLTNVSFPDEWISWLNHSRQGHSISFTAQSQGVGWIITSAPYPLAISY